MICKNSACNWTRPLFRAEFYTSIIVFPPPPLSLFPLRCLCSGDQALLHVWWGWRRRSSRPQTEQSWLFKSGSVYSADVSFCVFFLWFHFLASRLSRFWFWYPLQRNIICSFNCLQTCSWMCCPLYTVCCWSQGRASCSETFQTMFKAKVTVPLIWSLRCQTKPRTCSSLIFNLILFYVQFSVWCCDSTLLVLHTKSSYFH